MTTAPSPQTMDLYVMPEEGAELLAAAAHPALHRALGKFIAIAQPRLSDNGGRGPGQPWHQRWAWSDASAETCGSTTESCLSTLRAPPGQKRTWAQSLGALAMCPPVAALACGTAALNVGVGLAVMPVALLLSCCLTPFGLAADGPEGGTYADGVELACSGLCLPMTLCGIGAGRAASFLASNDPRWHAYANQIYQNREEIGRKAKKLSRVLGDEPPLLPASMAPMVTVGMQVLTCVHARLADTSSRDALQALGRCRVASAEAGLPDRPAQALLAGLEWQDMGIRGLASMANDLWAAPGAPTRPPPVPGLPLVATSPGVVEEVAAGQARHHDRRPQSICAGSMSS